MEWETSAIGPSPSFLVQVERIIETDEGVTLTQIPVALSVREPTETFL